MELMLVRHAAAEEFDPRAHGSDAERPLTKDGARIQRKVAGCLKRMGRVPDRILTSPRLRARQTAELTARAMGIDEPPVDSDALGEGYSVATVLELLAGHGDTDVVLCVGHEPDLSALAGVLLGPERGPTLEFKKSTVLGLRFHEVPAPGAAALLYMYRPADLAALA